MARRPLGRDEEGTLISECSFGGFAEEEWEGETTLDILRFWKLTKVEEKVRRGRFRGLRKTRYGGVWDWPQADKEACFHNCKALTKVNLPDEISNYSVALFEGCSNLSELTMPEWMEKRRLDIMDYAHGKK